MTGRKFTYMSDDGNKLSKIDRMLVSDNFMSKWPNAGLKPYPRVYSDHCPLMLCTESENFGPIPFRFFNRWLEDRRLVEIVTLVMGESLDKPTADLDLSERLRRMKIKIKEWRQVERETEEKVYSEALEMVNILELIAEDRNLSEEEKELRMLNKKVLNKWGDDKVKDLVQKSNAKWIKFGDDNTAYYHGLLKCYNAANRIKGLYIDGEWSKDPVLVKGEIFKFFKDKFKEPLGSRPKIDPNSTIHR
ncbi:uncharacterized protein LOC110943678 [Helianthus annuus]|uniref:uncharacterized protein LOC110943678 n=1 Tax=Helianthus annuus TaxID=4232 RepID=UPI000B8F77A3|nr:uncharacterized protein LOC110943678 [Helianthus annuus]